VLTTCPYCPRRIGTPKLLTAGNPNSSVLKQLSICAASFPILPDYEYNITYFIDILANKANRIFLNINSEKPIFPVLDFKFANITS
jgi:hypothetical protein